MRAPILTLALLALFLQAANATIEFGPKNVIPYHHRGQDTTVFRDLVNAGDASINVLLLDWYPAKADTTTH